MSRSKKKAILKDNGYGNKLYRRITKRSIKNKLKDQLLLTDLDKLELKNERNIINDYTRCDWVWDYENTHYYGNSKRINQEELNKGRRK